MEVSVLRWKDVSDFSWLFLLNPVQQVTYIPNDGNIHIFETECFVQNTKAMDGVQKHITVKPWFYDPAFCIFNDLMQFVWSGSSACKKEQTFLRFMPLYVVPTRV